MLSKRLNDLFRIWIPHTTPPPVPDKIVVPTPSAQVPPSWPMNRLKGEGLKTIIEEKILSIHGVVDKSKNLEHINVPQNL